MPPSSGPIPQAAFTIAIGPEAARQARLLRATFKAVHPGVPFLLVDGPLYARLTLQPGAAHAGEIMAMRAVIGRYLSHYVRRLLYLDADILVLSPLDALLPPDDETQVQADTKPPTPAVLLTGDRAHSVTASGLPPVNAGVLSAADPFFWRMWTSLIESRLLPLVGNFFDQYALRTIAAAHGGGGTLSCALLPEAAAGDFYNAAVLDVPGEWRSDGEALFKGEARLRLWHWAGYGTKPGLDALPAAARPLARRRMEEGRRADAASREADAALFESLLAPERLVPFFRQREAEIAAAQTVPLEGHFPAWTETRTPAPEGLWGTDVPAVWETLRTVPEGFHRRLLPQAPRWLYARSEARLHEPDVEKYDRPLWTGGAGE